MRSDARALTLALAWRALRRCSPRAQPPASSAVAAVLPCLHREWERLRKLARFPLCRRFERFDCARLIEMEHRVELVDQSRPKIVALPLGFGTVDHTDRPLEPRDVQLLHHHAPFVQHKQESVAPCGMKQRLVATGKRRANVFAL